MTLALVAVLLSQQPLPPPPPPSYSPATEREVTIKALREEIVELKDEKSGIGYVFPSLCIAAGAGLIAAGLLVNVGNTWFRPAMLISGTTISVLSTLWLIFRIAKTISLGGQIDGKEDQLRELERQRVTAWL